MLHSYGLDSLRIYVHAYEILRVTQQVAYLAVAILPQAIYESVLWSAQFPKARKYLTMPGWQLVLVDAPGGAIDVDDVAEAQLVAPEGRNQNVAAADWNVVKMQYCGCWAHTSTPGLKAPRDMPKADFGELVQRLCEGLFRTSSERRRTRLNKLGLSSVFQELHANQELHYQL